MWEFIAIGVLWIVWGIAAELAATLSVRAAEIIQAVVSIAAVAITFIIAHF